MAQLGGAVLTVPLVTRAQQPSIAFIGFLSTGSPNERAHLVEAFRRGLTDGGYVDGKNAAIEYRWAEGKVDRLPALARELASRNVAVIVATGGNLPALAAKSATSTIPIVFSGGGDPVKLGLVASLSRPGGNLTGITNVASMLEAKRLQLLHDLLPGAAKIVYLTNPNNPSAKASATEIVTTATAIGIAVETLNARTEGEIDSAFAAMKRTRASALLVAADAVFISRRSQIVALAARYAIPTSYPFREYPVAGGLMSYGPNIADGYRQVGVYAARILKGAKPADLPVLQISKLELVVNLRTAKGLGLAISRDFLARIDEVVE